MTLPKMIQRGASLNSSNSVSVRSRGARMMLTAGWKSGSAWARSR